MSAHGLPRAGVRIGNDIVALDDPRKVGRAADARLTSRILDDLESSVVEASAEPDLELWYHWAAKEAAFKVISKLEREPPAFVHAAFVSAWETPLDPASADWRVGTVRYGSAPVRVRARHTAEYVLAVGTGATQGSPVDHEVEGALASLDDDAWREATREELEARLSEREREAVHSKPSAAVRLAARAAIADTLGVEEARLEIVCAPGVTGRRPPYVLLDGEAAPADVSLAHDGPWIAWACYSPVGR